MHVLQIEGHLRCGDESDRYTSRYTDHDCDYQPLQHHDETKSFSEERRAGTRLRRQVSGTISGDNLLAHVNELDITAIKTRPRWGGDEEEAEGAPSYTN